MLWHKACLSPVVLTMKLPALWQLPSALNMKAVGTLAARGELMHLSNCLVNSSMLVNPKSHALANEPKHTCQQEVAVEHIL